MNRLLSFPVYKIVLQSNKTAACIKCYNKKRGGRDVLNIGTVTRILKEANASVVPDYS